MTSLMMVNLPDITHRVPSDDSQAMGQGSMQGMQSAQLERRKENLHGGSWIVR